MDRIHSRRARRRRRNWNRARRRTRTGKRTPSRNRSSVANGRLPVESSFAPSADPLEEDIAIPGKAAGCNYDEGYRQGYYEGGEAKVERQLPPYTLLPDLTIDDVIALGIQQVTASLVPVMSPTAVCAAVIRALEQRQPLSVIRLGDGEVLTLAHDMIISVEEAKLLGPFLPYAGVTLPDTAARRSLAESIRQANIVGIPVSRHPSFQGLLFPALNQHGISHRMLRITFSTVNYALHEQGLLYRMLSGRQLLLIGNKAAGLADVLGSRGLEVTGIITPVKGVHDVQRIIEQAASIEFDLALVAAGVAAVMICTAIAQELGKVSFDIGHLADLLVSGGTFLLPGVEVNG
ncbi:GT-D fold domain-containing glycosyltransferase [Paenibacillus humicus]|uniref:GT-D fold domain-containing protein n=1 Tax=Paenibacillus humicus TaxID=412861 RepID=UPI003D2A57CD